MSNYSGWYTTHRKIWSPESDFYNQQERRYVFLYLLSQAWYFDAQETCKFGDQEIYIRRGQCITGLKKISQAVSQTISKVRSNLSALKAANRITTETANNGTLITIINYDTYQLYSEKNANDLATTSASTLASTLANVTQSTSQTLRNYIINKQTNKKTNKQVNNILVSNSDEFEDQHVLKKETPLEKATRLAQPSDVDLAKRWASWYKEQSPTTKVNLATYIDSVRKIRGMIPEMHGLSKEKTLDGLFAFIQNDEFCRKNYGTPTGLLNKSKSDPSILKLDTVFRKFKQGADSYIEKKNKFENYVRPEWL